MASGKVTSEIPLQPSQDEQSESAERANREDAKTVFDKTISGHYRHGNSRYRRVGAIFITWKADDMQFKETAVGALEGLHDCHMLTRG